MLRSAVSFTRFPAASISPAAPETATAGPPHLRRSAWENGPVSFRRAADTHDGIERELNQERAAALLRISGTLDSLIAQLHAVRARVARLNGVERDREVAAYGELRREALRYRWYLEVQREALGLRHHHRLDEFYEIPASLER